MTSYRDVYTRGVEELFGGLRRRTQFQEKTGDAIEPAAVPQEGAPGLVVPFGINGSDVFDSSDTMDMLWYIPDVVLAIVDARIILSFREFFAPATAASSGGGSTSGSGGSSTPTSGSGDNVHSHIWASHEDDSPPALTKRQYGVGGVAAVTMALEGPPSNLSTSLVSVTHTHSVTVPSHTHTTPAHAHGLSYGVFKETLPASHSVNLSVYEWGGSSWDLLHTFTGLTDMVEEVDLGDYITEPGKYRISIQSAAAQPNSGRLGCDAAGYVVGAMQPR